MNEILIPTMLFWENGNSWYGSKGNARFFIKTQKHEEEGDVPAHTTLEAEVWRGPLTKALSEILSTASFPLSEEGLSQLVDWLEGQAASLNP